MGCGASKDQTYPTTTPLPLEKRTCNNKGSSLAQPVIPRITQKGVAFEIQMDANTNRRSLPSLLSPRDIQDKLAMSEARWKELEAISDKKKQKITKVDPEEMKKKLEERIRLASENRKREIEKLQSKLAKQERHARQVKERKKQLQIQQQEKLEVSVGGELDKFDRGESGKSLGSELTASDEWNSLSVDSRLSNSKSRIEHVGEVRSASSGQVF